MRCFKFFDWPRKIQTTSGNGGNVIVTAAANQSITTGGAAITNLTATIKTSGRPVDIRFISGNSNASYGVDEGHFRAVNNSNNAYVFLQIKRNGTVICSQRIGYNGASTESRVITVPPSALNFLDTGAPSGTHTYTVDMYCGGSSMAATNVKMIVMEL